MSVFEMVGYSAVGVLVVGWLVVSFTGPSSTRTVIEWFSATCLYVALTALFANLCHRAWSTDNTFALVAFGFLLVVFTSGTVVSLVNTAMSFRPGKRGSSATH